jgi:hypothetical protein
LPIEVALKELSFSTGCLFLSLQSWCHPQKSRPCLDFFRLANLASVLYPKQGETTGLRRDRALTKGISLYRTINPGELGAAIKKLAVLIAECGFRNANCGGRNLVRQIN